MRLIGIAVVPAVSLTLASFGGTAAAQLPEKVARVGYLNPGSSSDPLRQRRFEVFRQSLRELGYVDGQSIAIESRWAEGQPRAPGGKHHGDLFYGPDLVGKQLEVLKRGSSLVAVYVGKILRGAKPGDLPVEQPTRLELVVNRKTAKALGLTISQTLLLQADQVID